MVETLLRFDYCTGHGRTGLCSRFALTLPEDKYPYCPEFFFTSTIITILSRSERSSVQAPWLPGRVPSCISTVGDISFLSHQGTQDNLHGKFYYSSLDFKNNVHKTRQSVSLERLWSVMYNITLFFYLAMWKMLLRRLMI